jgi:hypothetical protein
MECIKDKFWLASNTYQKLTLSHEWQKIMHAILIQEKQHPQLP